MRGVPGRAWIALGVYVALLATLATPLYEPLESGRDDSWALLVLLIGAHVGLGAAVARIWVLLVPMAAAVAGFFATGGEALSWIIPVYVLPIALVLTAIGWAAGRLLRRHAGPAVIVVFVLAAAPAAWAGVQTAQRTTAPHVPESVQNQLPIDVSLGSLCPGAATPRRERRDAERRAEVLLRELERDAGALVTYTYYWADGGEARREITVRDLAEEQLEHLRAAGSDCAPALQRRIEAALA